MKSLLIGLALYAAPDSTLTPGKFVDQLLEGHPLVQNADLLVDASRSELLYTKGMLEPKVSLGYDRKQFDGKNYWNILDAGVKVPLLPGIDLYGDFQQNSGTFLNSERSIPSQGLLAAGVSIPLGRDLWISPARYRIQTAKLQVDQAGFRRMQQLNDLFLDGLTAYWKWCGAHEVWAVNTQAERISYEQLQQVKSSALLGERALIDTLESFIQWQNRQLQRRESEVELLEARQKILNFIWDDSLAAYIESERTIPLSLENDAYMPNYPIDSLESSRISVQNHPMIQDLAIQQEQLNIEERFRKNQLLPNIDFKYNLLNVPGDPLVAAQTLGTDFYKAGITFEMPIFLRKERAKLQLNRIKQQQVQNYQTTVRRKLVTGVTASFQNYQMSITNVFQARSLAVNYRRMLDAEIIKFQNGESSVFLLNQRENMLFNAQRKMISIEVKWRVSLMQYHHQKGDLVNFLSNF